MSNTIKDKFQLSVLIKKEDNDFVAHCLDFDIVTVAPALNKAKADIVSLIRAHIEYALSNDNRDHLFCPAPSDVWEEFRKCRSEKSEFHPENPYFNAEICEANDLKACHA